MKTHLTLPEIEITIEIIRGVKMKIPKTGNQVYLKKLNSIEQKLNNQGTNIINN